LTTDIEISQYADTFMWGADVWSAAKRLGLSVALIVLTSSILLLSDMARRKPHQGTSGSKSPRSGGPLPRPWKLYFIEYNQVLDVEESEQGVREGLQASGLVEGRDYQIKVVNSQGEMATVTALVDAAVTDRADLLVTFSTPTLQAAIQRAQGTPVVFTYVANGLIAGAGRSVTDHLPNVTGLSFLPPFDDMLGLIQQWFPRIHRIGTLSVPAESNMVYYLKVLQESAHAHGFEVVSVPVNSASEVADAATALASKDIDAICQIPGNLTVSAFGSISQAALRERLPVFAFQSSQAQEGAMLVLAQDYREAGHQGGGMAARIMLGENPRNIPLEWFSKRRVVLNVDAARKVRLQLPAGLQASAQQIIGKADGNQQTAAR
jgi:ABC-type uncharacterized transport system substrate-binding protein